MSELDTTAFAARIVAAYVAKNAIGVDQISSIIHTVREALSGLAEDTAGLNAEPAKSPAVSIKKSITPDYIVCLEDGKKLKMLKRHLRTAFSMTPDEYRAKWGLSSDYPMVAPNYAAQRSGLAKAIGLGKGRERGKAKG